MAYIVKQTNGSGRVYVHLAENHHIPELGQARQTRQHLGVLDPATGELLLSRQIEKLNPAILALLNKAGISCGKRRAPDPVRQSRKSGRQSLAADEPAAVEDIGEMHGLTQLCESIGLKKCLEVFGEDGAALFALAVWQVCTGDAQYLAEAWLDARLSPAALGAFDFSPSGMSALMDRTGGRRTRMDRFFQAWLAERCLPRAVIYDTTSISTCSEQLEDAEWGYNRDKEALPQINLAMAIDAGSGLPLAFRLLPGSISDVSTLATTGKFLAEYGLTGFSYCLDRGFFSNSNLRDMLQNSLHFVMGVPFTSNQALALAKQGRSLLQSSRSSILYGDEALRCAEMAWEVDMATKEQKDTPARKLKAFLFLNPERAVSRMQELERRLIGIEHLAAKQAFADAGKAEAWKIDNAKGLAKFFRVSKAAGAVRICRRDELVDEANMMAGLALYVADQQDKQMTAEQMLPVIRHRDTVEKVFDVFKNDNEQNRLRTGSAQHAQGRAFLGFLAAIVRTHLEACIRNAGLNKKLTTSEALAMLRKIRVVRFESGRRVMLEIPRKTRKLCAALNIPAPNPEHLNG